MMKTKNFFLTAALVLATAMTGAMMTSCSNNDIPVAHNDIPRADNEGNPPLPKGKTVDLSALSADYEAQDGETLMGPLKERYKISIAQGATVTLSTVFIDGGITCLGDATIILADDRINTVNGMDEGQPGIQAGGMGTTLIIRGEEKSTGKLSATGGDGAAGIGSRAGGSCGDIMIVGGVIEATGGLYAAGIGTGGRGRCGKITIRKPATGTANGGEDSPSAIGAGDEGECGEISVEDNTIIGIVDHIDDPNGGDSPNVNPNGGDSPAGDEPIIVPAGDK